MKINKEYPATHSMDTAWFVSDLDGNVAIFQFEEDGPGPIPFTDLHTDELIPMLGDEKDGISVMPFTKDQITELKSGLKPVNNAIEIRSMSNLLVLPEKVDALIRAGAKFDLCYSKEEGFYHLMYWNDYKEEDVQAFIDKGYVLGAQQCDIEIYFSDKRDDQTEHRLAHFPFYVYEQTRCINFPPERLVVPKYPLKVEQMPDGAKKYMFPLPLRFAEKKCLEPSEFIDSQCWLFNNHTKDVNGIKYMQVALSDGGYGYVKVIPHGYDAIISEEWKSAPRVIDKSDEYIDVE